MAYITRSGPSTSRQNMMAGTQGIPLVVTQTLERRYSLGWRRRGFMDSYRPARTCAACMKSSRYSQNGRASPRCPATIRS
jgi:hypothetical protein